MIRIASWNLNHRTLEKPIPSSVLDYLTRSDADVILLNEYVDRGTRNAFRESLADAGYLHQDLSPVISNHNQVFAASKAPLERGDLVAPQFDGSSKTNFLHIKIPTEAIEIVGFRAPAYKLKSDRDRYWDQLRSVMAFASDRPICFIGDANYNPFQGAATSAQEVAFDADGIYRVPNPSGEWSYISLNGKNRSRIDHAFLSSRLEYADPAYVTTCEGVILAGPRDTFPASDHAVLTISVSPNKLVEQGRAHQSTTRPESKFSDDSNP